MCSALYRDEHPLLSKNDPQSLFSVAIKHLNFYKFIKFDSDFLFNNGLNDFLSVPLTNDSFDVDFKFEYLVKQSCVDQTNKVKNGGSCLP